MSDRFWYLLAGSIFVLINIILWFYFRWCKARGIKPKPAFQGLKKHEKRISKWTDILLIMLILLEILFCGYHVVPDLIQSFSETYPVKEMSYFSGFITLFFFSAIIIAQASSLSPFQNNITVKKRIILLVMCCMPLVFWIPLWLQKGYLPDNKSLHLKNLLTGLLIVFCINGPAIILGKPFTEFFPELLRKIPLPWFQFPKEKETNES